MLIELRRIVASLFALAILASAPSARAGAYSYTTLDVPGSTSTVASGINDTGLIVGTYQGADLFTHGFLRDAGGTYTTIDVPGSTRTILSGINDAGLIVGTYDNSLSFLRDAGGTYTTIDVLGSLITRALGINDAGLIVGYYTVFDSGSIGFVRDASGAFDSSVAPGSGINDAGLIVGTYSEVEIPDSITHGFVFVRDVVGSFVTLDVPGSTSTVASGINDAGLIVGTYYGPFTHGFLRDAGGTYTTIDVPGSVITRALGINDAGLIVGTYVDANNNSHGFIATPVPEPSTLTLCGLAAPPVLCVWAWRRRGRAAG